MPDVALAKSGYYDNTPLRRMSADLTLHAGDPTATGYGDPGYTVAAEKSQIPFEPGTVGMLPVTDKTVCARFFITLTRRPDLDGTRAVLGRVESNTALLDLLASQDQVTKVVITVMD